MHKYFVSIAIVILSVAIIFLGIKLSVLDVSQAHSEQKVVNTNIEEKGLLTIEETAAYLSMPVEDFKRMLTEQALNRKRAGNFTTYKFIPYVTVHETKYFNKKQLDEWIKESTTTWAEYN